MELVSEERLLYLSRQVAHMRLTEVNRRELAEIALETLVMRIELERIFKESTSREQMELVNSNLKRLTELEESIVSLYYMAKLKGERWADSSIFSSFIRRYPYERER